MDTYAVHEPLAQPLGMEHSRAWCWHWLVGCSEAGHLRDVGIELLYLTYKLMYADALWLLKYICNVVLFLLSHVDRKRGEKVKHHAIAKRLTQHSPWALHCLTLKVDVGVAFRLLTDDLVLSVSALRRKQVRIEREHLACGSGHSSLRNAMGLFSLLKIT